MLVVTPGLHQGHLPSHHSDLPDIKPAPTQYPIHLHREDEAGAFTAHDCIPSPERLRSGIYLAVSSPSPYFILRFKPSLLSVFPHFPSSIPLQAAFLTTQEQRDQAAGLKIYPRPFPFSL